MSIKRANLSDMETIYEITQTTITDIYPHYYPKGAVEFFLEHHNKSNIERDIQSGIVFLCFDCADNAVGTITLRDNEICRLFVLPEHQKKGFGQELLDFAETTIFKAYNEIILDASLPAKIIYRKRGYCETESNIIRTECGDCLCYDVMRKQK